MKTERQCGPRERRPITVIQILEATEGGALRHVLDILRGAQGDDLTHSLICSVKRNPGVRAEIEGLRQYGVGVDIIPMVRPIRPLRDFVALARLFLLLRRKRPDVVHTHCAKAGFLGRIAARLAGVPCVVHTPHQLPFEMTVGPVKKWIYRRLERFAARFADRIVCVCPHQQRLMLRHRIAPAGKLCVIPNGVSIDGPRPSSDDVGELRRELSLESDAPVVGFVGRLCTQKDPLSFVLAARKCADTHPGTQFIVAGDGPLRRDVEEAVDCLGLRKQCHVLGHRTDMDRILGLIDVLVQPSLWEGLPYVVLDAMARGKAVVASEVGGLGDVIKPGNNGMLVPVRDPDAVAETIGRLLGDTELRASLGRHARATVAGSYRLQDILAALRHLYGSLRSIDRAGVPRCVE